MAELIYFTGPMDCGKSTLALQLDYTHAAAGRRGQISTSRDGAGAATNSSRLGLTRPAHEVTTGFDFWAFAGERRAGGDPLARLVDDLEVDVFAFGIRPTGSAEGPVE